MKYDISRLKLTDTAKIFEQSWRKIFWSDEIWWDLTSVRSECKIWVCVGPAMSWLVLTLTCPPVLLSAPHHSTLLHTTLHYSRLSAPPNWLLQNSPVWDEAVSTLSLISWWPSQQYHTGSDLYQWRSLKWENSWGWSLVTPMINHPGWAWCQGNINNIRETNIRFLVEW